MNHWNKIFSEFWAKVFNLELNQFYDKGSMIVTEGKYVERYGDQYIYRFEDIVGGKVIVAGTPKNKAQILDIERAKSSEFVPAGFKVVFEDIDYILKNPEDFQYDFKPADIRPLKTKEDKTLEIFYQGVSEDDKDTLDLTFENEFAFGLYLENTLIGISRYAPLKDDQRIADITIVMHSAWRGRGFGTGLVAHAVKDLLGKGLCPRYRVNEHLTSSVSIAKRLGLTPAYRLKTFERENES